MNGSPLLTIIKFADDNQMTIFTPKEFNIFDGKTATIISISKPTF